MSKCGHLDWTALNPSAPAFIPRSHQSNAEDMPRERLTTDDGLGNERSDASTCGAVGNKVTKRSGNKKWKPVSGKPSVLTLEQIITEKLKIDTKSHKENQKTVSNHSKKAQTYESPHNLL
ncbi:unnamed protein product, partial [Medioppia subpectinata]